MRREHTCLDISWRRFDIRLRNPIIYFSLWRWGVSVPEKQWTEFFQGIFGRFFLSGLLVGLLGLGVFAFWWELGRETFPVPWARWQTWKFCFGSSFDRSVCEGKVPFDCPTFPNSPIFLLLNFPFPYFPIPWISYSSFSFPPSFPFPNFSVLEFPFPQFPFSSIFHSPNFPTSKFSTFLKNTFNFFPFPYFHHPSL